MTLEPAAAQDIQDVRDRLRSASLLDAIGSRRSRRFARGMTLNGGPLAYASKRRPNRSLLRKRLPWPLPHVD